MAKKIHPKMYAIDMVFPNGKIINTSSTQNKNIMAEMDPTESHPAYNPDAGKNNTSLLKNKKASKFDDFLM